MTRNEEAISVVFGGLVGYAVASLLLALPSRKGEVVPARTEMQYCPSPPVEDSEALPPVEESFEIDPALSQVTVLYERHSKVMSSYATQGSSNGTEVAITVLAGYSSCSTKELQLFLVLTPL